MRKRSAPRTEAKADSRTPCNVGYRPKKIQIYKINLMSPKVSPEKVRCGELRLLEGLWRQILADCEANFPVLLAQKPRLYGGPAQVRAHSSILKLEREGEEREKERDILTPHCLRSGLIGPLSGIVLAWLGPGLCVSSHKKQHCLCCRLDCMKVQLMFEHCQVF